MKQGPMVPPAVRRGSIGSRRGARGPVGTLWRAQGVRTSVVHQYGQSSDPLDDYMLRAALEVIHVFCQKPTCPQNLPIFAFCCDSPNGYAHSNCTAILCKGVWLIRKVTLLL